MDIRKWILSQVAYYDPSRNKIVNCEEGDHAWYHEQRHMQQNKGMFFWFFSMFIYGSLAGVVVLQLWWIAVPALIMVIALEFDAEIYANRQDRRNKI